MFFVQKGLSEPDLSGLDVIKMAVGKQPAKKETPKKK
jgi:hypothetical protein